MHAAKVGYWGVPKTKVQGDRTNTEISASASNWWAEIFAGTSSWAIGRPDLVSEVTII
jgi:hypothetical protein